MYYSLKAEIDLITQIYSTFCAEKIWFTVYLDTLKYDLSDLKVQIFDQLAAHISQKVIKVCNQIPVYRFISKVIPHVRVRICYFSKTQTGILALVMKNCFAKKFLNQIC